MVHGLVGTPIWVSCWGEDRENHITPTTVIPYQLLLIAQQAVTKLERNLQALRDKAAAEQVILPTEEQVLERLTAARRTSAARLRGGPY